MQKSVLSLSLLIFAMTVPCPAQPERQEEQNKTTTRLFFEEVLSQGKLENYAQSHTTDFVGHGDKRDFSLPEDMAAAREERTALPDMQFAINHLVAENDLVAVHWVMWGTNSHPGLGLPATGKEIKLSGFTLFRFKGGKISEEWGAYNMLSVLKQLGLWNESTPVPVVPSNP